MPTNVRYDRKYSSNPNTGEPCLLDKLDAKGMSVKEYCAQVTGGARQPVRTLARAERPETPPSLPDRRREPDGHLDHGCGHALRRGDPQIASGS